MKKFIFILVFILMLPVLSQAQDIRGTFITISTIAGLLDSLATKVNLSDNQTVAGEKTFTDTLIFNNMRAQTGNRISLKTTDTLGVNIIQANDGTLDIIGNLVNMDSLEVDGSVRLGNSAVVINEADSTSTFEKDATFNAGITADSLNIIGATSPRKYIAFADWYGVPTGTTDTLEVVADTAKVGTGFFDAVFGKVPDSTSTSFDGIMNEVQEIQIFREKFEVPIGLAGVDSIVFDYKTTAGDIDSNAVKVQVLEYSLGTSTHVDSTAKLTSVGAFAHDNSLSSLDAIGRNDHFEIRITFRSNYRDNYAWVSRFIIYWKEGS